MCVGIAKIPNSNRGKGQIGPGENPERPLPNCMKRTDNPKHGDMTDTSMGKKLASSGQETAHKWPLVKFCDHWHK